MDRPSKKYLMNSGINLLGLEDISIQLGVPENLTVNFNLMLVVYALAD